MSKKIAIIGAGGHGKVVGEIALLNGYKTIHFFDERYNEINKFPFQICGKIDYLKNNLKYYDTFFVSIGNSIVRSEKTEWLKKHNVKIVNLIHPKSIISKFSNLGTGNCIMANAIVNPGTSIDEGVILNTACSIDHDCVIEKFVNISPNCALSGNVRIGKFSQLGTGTSVHPGIHIGENVKTAVGSSVYKNILDNSIFRNKL